MSFLIKEYKIPLLGKVELLGGTGYNKSFYGEYYAQNKKLGHGFVKGCNSTEELQTKVMEEIKEYFNQQKTILELAIESKKEKLNKLEGNLLDIDEEIENNSFEWLEQYQTDNCLQREYQEVEKQKQK